MDVQKEAICRNKGSILYSSANNWYYRTTITLSKCLMKLLFIIQPLSTVFTHSALQDDAAAATQTPKSTEKIATVHMKATLVLLTSSSIAGGPGDDGQPAKVPACTLPSMLPGSSPSLLGAWFASSVCCCAPPRPSESTAPEGRPGNGENF